MAFLKAAGFLLKGFLVAAHGEALVTTQYRNKRIETALLFSFNKTLRLFLKFIFTIKHQLVIFTSK